MYIGVCCNEVQQLAELPATNTQDSEDTMHFVEPSPVH